jgi:segregation and condensation protein B
MDLTNNNNNKSFDLEQNLEAMIFVSKEPLSFEKIMQILGDIQENIRAKDVRDALKSLQAKWQNSERSCGRAIYLTEMAHGFIFATVPSCAPVLRRLLQEKPQNLSRAQVEVLSIIAYRQPITRVDVDDIRGVDSASSVKRLMQLNLVKILGKAEGLGRPLLYGTTRHFLEFFSLNSLNELPTLSQFDSLSQGELESVADTAGEISLKDLFENAKNATLLSGDLERQSEDALKSLDEALLRIDSLEKSQSN